MRRYHEEGYKIVIFRCAGGRLVKYRLYVYAAGPCVCVAHSRCLGGPLAPLPKRRAASAAAHTRSVTDWPSHPAPKPPLQRRSNQGGIKAALGGKMASNVKGRVEGVVAGVRGRILLWVRELGQVSVQVPTCTQRLVHAHTRHT